LLIACASGSGKPPASSDDASGASEGATAATEPGKSGDATAATPTESNETVEPKSEDKKDVAAAPKAGDGEAASPKDDSRTTAACAKVIKDNRKNFQKCYSGRSDLHGEVHLVVELDAAGKVKKASIDDDSTVTDAKVRSCIVDLAKTLTYPASTKGLEKDFDYKFGINNVTQ
jgi:hypothetical protein